MRAEALTAPDTPHARVSGFSSVCTEPPRSVPPSHQPSGLSATKISIFKARRGLCFTNKRYRVCFSGVTFLNRIQTPLFKVCSEGPGSAGSEEQAGAGGPGEPGPGRSHAEEASVAVSMASWCGRLSPEASVPWVGSLEASALAPSCQGHVRVCAQRGRGVVFVLFLFQRGRER